TDDGQFHADGLHRHRLGDRAQARGAADAREPGDADPDRIDADLRDCGGVRPFPWRAGAGALGRGVRPASSVHQHLGRPYPPETQAGPGPAVRSRTDWSAAAGRQLVPHSRPLVGPAEEEAAARVLRSGRLAPGAEAARLERLLARLSDTADAVALSSGTMALTLALRAI